MNRPIHQRRGVDIVVYPFLFPVICSFSIRSLPGSFVGRMQYAPTMIRKCYVMIRSFRSLLWSFVVRMQYAPTLPDEKRMSQNVFAVLFETQNRFKMFSRWFLRIKIEFKHFFSAFWGSKSSKNAFELLFEAQNWVQMFLWYFLRLKIESKYFWGAFWGSKSSQNVFEVLFEPQNVAKVFLRSIFCIRWR